MWFSMPWFMSKFARPKSIHYYISNVRMTLFTFGWFMEICSFKSAFYSEHVLIANVNVILLFSFMNWKNMCNIKGEMGLLIQVIFRITYMSIQVIIFYKVFLATVTLKWLSWTDSIRNDRNVFCINIIQEDVFSSIMSCTNKLLQSAFFQSKYCKYYNYVFFSFMN